MWWFLRESRLTRPLHLPLLMDSASTWIRILIPAYGSMAAMMSPTILLRRHPKRNQFWMGFREDIISLASQRSSRGPFHRSKRRSCSSTIVIRKPVFSEFMKIFLPSEVALRAKLESCTISA
jgi:hypothetical protein